MGSAGVRGLEKFVYLLSQLQAVVHCSDFRRRHRRCTPGPFNGMSPRKSAHLHARARRRLDALVFAPSPAVFPVHGDVQRCFRKAGARRELKGAQPNEEPFRYGGFGSRNSSPQSL